MLRTPILFLVFNRPKETAAVFEEIRKAQPTQLFIAADGPRANRADDAENSRMVREIAQRVDWSCEVKTLFRDKNLGCRNAVSDGITWFFSQVQEGIVLEDDCLPHPTFFSYCESLLEKYRNDETVMHIGANNFQDGIQRGQGSYYFSRIPHIWGWASWQRAWKHYDVNMRGLENFIKNEVDNSAFSSWNEKAYWLQTFRRVQRGEINTWDYQWSYALLKHKGKAITPQVNLVSNIGFGSEATHTGNTSDWLGQLQIQGIENIVPPSNTEISKVADLYWYRKVIPWQLKLKTAAKYLLNR